MARYGEGAVDQELPLADKLRRDGERSRKAAPVFNTGPVASKSQPAKEEVKEEKEAPWGRWGGGVVGAERGSALGGLPRRGRGDGGDVARVPHGQAAWGGRQAGSCGL